MKPRSSKAKGKTLERWIRDAILAKFPELTPEDVRVPIGSETGADIKLTKKALDRFPYRVEAKNRETFKTLYSYYEQAMRHAGPGEPIVVVKSNRRPPLILIDAEYFFNGL